jgi:hypothetical protein
LIVNGQASLADANFRLVGARSGKPVESHQRRQREAKQSFQFIQDRALVGQKRHGSVPAMSRAVRVVAMLHRRLMWQKTGEIHASQIDACNKTIESQTRK